MITPSIEWINEQIPQLEQQLEQLSAQYNYVRGMRDVLIKQREMLQNGAGPDAADEEE